MILEYLLYMNIANSRLLRTEKFCFRFCISVCNSTVYFLVKWTVQSNQWPTRSRWENCSVGHIFFICARFRFEHNLKPFSRADISTCAFFKQLPSLHLKRWTKRVHFQYKWVSSLTFFKFSEKNLIPVSCCTIRSISASFFQSSDQSVFEVRISVEVPRNSGVFFSRVKTRNS